MSITLLKHTHLLPWTSDGRPILQRNTDTVLNWRSGGYHLVELDLHPQRADCPIILTTEGFERCPRCLVVAGHIEIDEHIFQRLKCGREHEEAVDFCVMRCGRPFSAAADPSKARFTHEKTCDGTVPMLSLDGETLACPRCRFPGLQWDTFSRHISKCQGDRRDAAKDVHEIWLGLKSQKYMAECKCGFLITFRASSTHVCGLAGDPAWFGVLKDIPDTSVPLLKWYQDHDLGFGGAPLSTHSASISSPLTYASQVPLHKLPADGVAIADEVVARHYVLFNCLISNAQPSEDLVSKIAAVQDLLRLFYVRSEAFVRYCKRQAEGLEEEGPPEAIDEDFVVGDDPEAGEGLEDDLVEELDVVQRVLDDFGNTDSLLGHLGSGLPHGKSFIHPINYHAETRNLTREFLAKMKTLAVDQRSELADDAVKGLRNLLNRATLQWAGITHDEPVLSRACPGFQWRHAQHACPWGVENIDLSHAHITPKFGAFYLIAPACSGCWDLAAKFAKWVNLSKYSSDGRPICCSNGCQETRWIGKLCKSHRETDHRKRVRDTITLASDSKGTIDNALQALLTTEDLETSLSHVTPRERGNPHDPWERVAAEVFGECQPTNVFFVDTEWAYAEGRRLLFEVSFVDGSGKNLLTTTIDHGCTIEHLTLPFKRNYRNIIPYALGIYSREGNNRPAQLDDQTHGLTPDELRDRMREIGIGPDSIVVEWSVGRCDRANVTECVGSDFDSGTWVTGMEVLKTMGWRGTRQLISLFSLFFPNDPKRWRAHRANIDAIKTLQLMRKLLGYLYRPRSS
ncbi:uncharacterized protein CCOS01_08487 [Colletotrichum costaricense]|uniref:Uncharacterized protein n=1 Tax=Colletotrichum costaricense TaxID=1209916 RepID=A0AAI9YWS1_9PEZI|nr:uncharacterized protein CCOS01_08487 [Colletotrichum costaricense]KAK1526069.1 hypothetical protein CCOS01_08487 [Colletotrichum costaricense]